MLLQFDGTLLIIAISFIIFAVIMHHIFYVPMRRVIEERDEYIFVHIDEAKRLRAKAYESVDQYNQKINKTRMEGQQKVEDKTILAKKEKSKIISDASQSAHGEINNARTVLNEEKNVALDALKSDVAPLAQQIVSKILGTSVAISGIDQEKVDKILRG